MDPTRLRTAEAIRRQMPALKGLRSPSTGSGRTSVAVGYGNQHEIRMWIDEETCGIGPSCSVTLTMPKSFLKRFTSWCGATTVNFTIPAGQTGKHVQCGGPGFFGYGATLFDPDWEYTTHTVDVSVTITLVEAP